MDDREALKGSFSLTMEHLGESQRLAAGHLVNGRCLTTRLLRKVSV
jgi:hypothetical protein